LIAGAGIAAYHVAAFLYLAFTVHAVKFDVANSLWLYVHLDKEDVFAGLLGRSRRCGAEKKGGASYSCDREKFEDVHWLIDLKGLKKRFRCSGYRSADCGFFCFLSRRVQQPVQTNVSEAGEMYPEEGSFFGKKFQLFGGKHAAGAEVDAGRAVCGEWPA